MWYRLGAWLALALAVLPLSCVPFDIDSIACNGHGQCPIGYHCELSSGQSVGTASVCVPGEATAAGLGASVQRVNISFVGEALGLLGALHTNRAELPWVQEAINEDVLGLPLLLGTAVQDDPSFLQPRDRPGGGSLYDPIEGQYMFEGEQPAVRFVAPSLAERSSLDFGVGDTKSDTLEGRTRYCGQGSWLQLDNSPQTFSEGTGWQVESMFNSGGSVRGPAMPALPNPQGGQLTAGRILLAHGSPLRLQLPGAGLDPSALDTFLLLGEGFVDGNSPHCGEVECSDGADNDGDGRVDCDDPDCQGKGNAILGADCPESQCGDGIDNDSDGDIDCADVDDCSDRDCTPRSADVVAYPVSEEGSIELPWAQLPQFVSSGVTGSLMAWGRTRSSIALDVNSGTESAMLSSSQWQVYETVVLDSSQYVVSVDAQHDKGAAGRTLNLELTPLDGLKEWTGDYMVGGVDRFGHLFAAYPRSDPEALLATASEGNSLSVQLDASPLCRGVTTIAVTNASFPESGDDVCADCGIGTLDDRHPSLQCDVVLPPGAQGADVAAGQVVCASFDEPKLEEESRAHLYSFEAIAGTSYQIEGIANQVSLDSDINLQFTFHYDDNGSFRVLSEGEGGLAQSEQDYCGRDPRLVWQCRVSGRYRLKVEPTYSAGDGGPYRLLIEVL